MNAHHSTSGLTAETEHQPRPRLGDDAFAYAVVALASGTVAILLTAEWAVDAGRRWWRRARA